MRKSVLRLAGWRAASWAETVAVARVTGAMAKRQVAKARGRATAAEEGAQAALTEGIGRLMRSDFIGAIEMFERCRAEAPRRREGAWLT